MIDAEVSCSCGSKSTYYISDISYRLSIEKHVWSGYFYLFLKKFYLVFNYLTQAVPIPDGTNSSLVLVDCFLKLFLHIVTSISSITVLFEYESFQIYLIFLHIFVFIRIKVPDKY